MDGDVTPRFSMPLLHAGQAQKEVDHNEAIALIDLALHATVIAAGRNVPPEDPAAGQCWIVGVAPVGQWAGRAGSIAGWSAGGWRFVAPRAGMAAWDAEERVALRYDGVTWTRGVARTDGLYVDGEKVVGQRGSAITPPVGGSVVDQEAREALIQILNALQEHGLVAP